MLKLLYDGVQFIERALVECVDRRMVDHQQRDLVIVIQAMSFDPQVAPGLNNLPRLGQSAKVTPLRNGALNLFH